MAQKPARSSAPKKARHSAAQKKQARVQRQQGASSAPSNGEKAPRWNDEMRAARGAKPSTRGRAAASWEDRRESRPSEGRSERSPESRGYRGRDDNRSGGGYQRDDRSGGGYRGRDDNRSGGGYQRDDRSGGGYRGRDDRQGGGYRGRDDNREQTRGYGERSFRTHREEREGRPDRYERPETRRPSNRDRASHEATRYERPARTEQAPVSAPTTTAAPQAASSVPAAGSAAPRSRGPEAKEVTGDNGFAALGLHADLVAALARQGITDPFPIQAATIPDALAGRDLLGRGQTGSGKTMAFGLPTLHRLAEMPRATPHRPHAIILTPTRELANQIYDALRPLMSALKLRQQLIAGGMSYTPQLRSLEEGVDVLVATPGRLSDLIERRSADLSKVAVTILDEADHMAEMGFVEAISEILDLTPDNGQRLLFSATLDHGVDKVAKKYLTDPITHSTNDAQASVSTMDHHVFLVHPHDKKSVTAAIANREGRTVVFVRTKLGADRVALQLRESGVFAAALHGGLNQAQRTRVLEGFKSSEIPVLVATDVAARGIHVDDVSLVLQADPPADHKDYLHRSGRTARAGSDGVVVTLALPHQKRQVQRMLDSAGVDASPMNVNPEDEAVISTAGGRTPTAEPIPQSRLDDVLRPPRRGRPGGRPGGGGYRGRNGGGDRGGRSGGGYRGRENSGGRGGDRGGRPPRGADRS